MWVNLLGTGYTSGKEEGSIVQYLYAKVSAEVKAEPEKLWDIVADFANHPRLAGSQEVQRVRPLTRGPVRVGYRVVSNQRVAGVPYLTQSIVTQAERGKILYLDERPERIPGSESLVVYLSKA